jgi:hypothetical protein
MSPMKDYEIIDGIKTYIRKSNWGPADGDGVYLTIDLDDNHWWCEDALIHREGGPAVIRSSGLQQWLIRGELHREDGPAAIWHGIKGNLSASWYLHGNVQHTFKEFQENSKCSDEDIVLLKLKWGEIA